MRWPFHRRRRLAQLQAPQRYRNPYFSSSSAKPNADRAILEIIGLSLAFLILLGGIILGPYIFGIQTIVIKGAEKISAGDIESSLRTKLTFRFLGWSLPVNAVTIKQREVADLLSRTYSLQLTSFSRRWPSTLTLMVKEATPVFALELSQDNILLMTSEGRIIGQLSDTEKDTSLPRLKLDLAITVMANEEIINPEVSQHIVELSEKLRSMGILYTDLTLRVSSCKPFEQGNATLNTNEEPLNSNKSSLNISIQPTPCLPEMQVRTAEDINIRTEEGYDIILSLAEDIVLQLDKFKAFMNNEPDAKIQSYIDLRVPERIYYK